MEKEKDKDKVINIKRDDRYYMTKANACMLDKDFLQAIKYFHKAVNAVENSKLHHLIDVSYKIALGQAYSFVNDLDMANYYFYTSLKYEYTSQVAYLWLGENFMKADDDQTARFYFNQSINYLPNSEVAERAKLRLEILNKVNHKGFRVVGGQSVATKQKLAQAEDYMSRCKFEKAVEIYEKYGDFSDPKTRAELSLAYFFLNDTKKGTELIKEHGQNTLLDLCNLLLIYYCEDDKENFDKTKDELLNYKISKDEDYFKIGLTFAQTGLVEKAKIYMQNFLSKAKYEPEFEFLYCLTCINAKDYETARKKLIDLKALNPIKSYVYDYYILLCSEKRDEKVEYVFSLPVKEYLKVQNKIKEFMLLGKDELLEAFLQNKDMFYFIASLPETNAIKMLLVKLATIENKHLINFFDYVLLNDYTKPKTKERLVMARGYLDSVDIVGLVRDDVYTRVVFPETKDNLKLTQEGVFQAGMNAIEYFLSKTHALHIELNLLLRNKNIAMLPKVFDVSALSVYYVLKNAKSYKDIKLRDVCAYFDVSQEDFYKFIEENKLDMI